MTNQPLSYGAKLCPVCHQNEVVWAKSCKKCCAKDYYQNNREKILKASKARAKKLADQVKQQTQRIEIHIFVHVVKDADAVGE